MDDCHSLVLTGITDSKDHKYGLGPDIANKIVQYDAAGAMFYYADMNHDGKIDQSEFGFLCVRFNLKQELYSYQYVLFHTILRPLFNSHSKTSFTSRKISPKNSRGLNEEFEVLKRPC
jgi:hypothetical protein